MIHAFLYFLSYLFLLPFFIRILFRFHRISLGHPLSFLILQITNPFLYQLTRSFPSSLYWDKAATLFTFSFLFFMNQLRLLGHSHAFLEVICVVTLLDWLNRIFIIYLCMAFFKISLKFINLAPSLESIIDEFTLGAVHTIHALLKNLAFIPKTIRFSLALGLWITCLIFIHLLFEQWILIRLIA